MKRFEPPEGWTFMARTLEEMHVGGNVAPEEPAMLFVAAAFQQVHGSAVRAYVYPQMVLVMVWSIPNNLWVGTAVSREPKSRIIQQ